MGSRPGPGHREEKGVSAIKPTVARPRGTPHAGLRRDEREGGRGPETRESGSGRPASYPAAGEPATAVRGQGARGSGRRQIWAREPGSGQPPSTSAAMDRPTVARRGRWEAADRRMSRKGGLAGGGSNPQGPRSDRLPPWTPG